MKIQGKHYQTIWLKEGNNEIVQVIDQRKLPFQFEIFELKTVEDAFFAIKEMVSNPTGLLRTIYNPNDFFPNFMFPYFDKDIDEEKVAVGTGDDYNYSTIVFESEQASGLKNFEIEGFEAKCKSVMVAKSTKQCMIKAALTNFDTKSSQ